MTDTANEKFYFDSIFCGVSVDSAPIRDAFGENFISKNFKVTLEFSNEQLRQACTRLNCSEENFFMGVYALLLARFAGADEVFFAATSTKKIPVFLNLSSDQNIADYLKVLREQVNRSRETIAAPYEDLAKLYDFPNAPEFISTSNEKIKASFVLQVTDENPRAVSIYFDSGKYSDALAESFIAAYKHVVAKFLDAEKIGDIDWLSTDELTKLQNFHDTDWEVSERPAYRLLQDSAEKYDLC